MKRLLLLVCSLIPLLTHSQSDDKQWYIIDAQGLEGTSNSYDNDITSNIISIKKVGFPANTSEDDVFIIYHDVSMFSTRKNIPGNNSLTITDSNGSDEYIIESPTGTVPQYLYYTNKYEDDDPTNDISVTESTGTPTYSIVGNTEGETIWAHQNITPTKDIVLAISRDSLKNICPDWTTAEICYNIVEDPSGTQSSYAFLSEEPVFKNVSSQKFMLKGGPSGPIAFNKIVNNVSKPTGLTERCLTLNNNDFLHGAFVYINLSSIGNLTGLIRDNKKAIFKIYCDGNQDPSIIEDEEILSFNDPNFIQIQNICYANGAHYIDYRLQFYNNENYPLTENLKSTLSLPADVDPSSVCVQDFRVGDVYASTSTLYNVSDMVIECTGNQITFNFPIHDLCAVPSKAPSIPDCAYGSVDFCVKLNAGVNVQTVNLQPSSPINYFGAAPYPIHDFMDIDTLVLTQKESTTILESQRPISNTCSCKCVPSYSCSTIGPGPGVIISIIVGIALISFLLLRRRP